MRRRDFIGTLGAIMAAPVLARADQTAMPVIGFLGSTSPDGWTPYLAAFRDGLREAGYVEGDNVTIEFRWAEGDFDRLPSLARELVGRSVDLIAASGTPASVAAKAATATIPIVFSAGADPVEVGLVSSLNRPSGNVTGMSQFVSDLGPKRLSIARDLLPATTAVAVLVNPESATSVPEMKQVKAAAGSIGQKIHVVNAARESDLERAFGIIAQQRAGALLVTADGLFLSRPDQIVALAAARAIPTIYFAREFVLAGGLVSYGSSIADGYRQIGVYAGRILKGARISDLPIPQPTKFELVINLKTAKALGLTIPPLLLARADEVIE